MTQEFYSNGKLLISGEYAVLDGALAWAMPTKYGQYLRITPNSSSQITWKSLDEKNTIWFEGSYDLNSLKEQTSSDLIISTALIKILSEARQLNPEFLLEYKGLEIETELTFPKDWGLGSSSTLINNVANWAKVNAHELLANTFGGSGYDIACAQHNSPILFQIKEELPTVQIIHENLPFTSSLYFIYLNQKKNSRDAIAAYRKRSVNTNILIKELSQITEKMIKARDISEFDVLVQKHENVLSEALGIPTVKSELFPDYKGAIKSLGGWGGDFILAIGDAKTNEYFERKGYSTVISFSEMIL
ncbi:MAG: GYDIA family GHMP kinase [Maribacter sp.]